MVTAVSSTTMTMEEWAETTEKNSSSSTWMRTMSSKIDAMHTSRRQMDSSSMDMDHLSSSTTEADRRTLLFITKEGDGIRVPMSIAKQMGLVQKYLEELDENKEEDEENEEEVRRAFPVPKLPTDVFYKVVHFLEHHLHHPMDDIDTPLHHTDLSEVVSSWDVHFIDVSPPMLFALVTAADYLDIPTLLALSSAKLATLLMGKSAEEMRIFLNHPLPYSPEEQAEVDAENAAILELGV